MSGFPPSLKLGEGYDNSSYWEYPEFSNCQHPHNVNYGCPKTQNCNVDCWQRPKFIWQLLLVYKQQVRRSFLTFSKIFLENQTYYHRNSLYIHIEIVIASKARKGTGWAKKERRLFHGEIIKDVENGSTDPGTTLLIKYVMIIVLILNLYFWKQVVPILLDLVFKYDSHRGSFFWAGTVLHIPLLWEIGS